MADILLIDDDMDMHAIVKFFLEYDDHTVTCVADGLEGLEYLRHNKSDLVLLDIAMPKMNGMEVLQNIQNEFGKQAPPVIFMTVFDRSQLSPNLNDTGCVGYIRKPVQFDQFRHKLRTVLDKT